MIQDQNKETHDKLVEYYKRTGTGGTFSHLMYCAITLEQTEEVVRRFKKTYPKLYKWIKGVNID